MTGSATGHSLGHLSSKGPPAFWSNTSVKHGKTTGGQTSGVFGETLCLPTGRQGGTFFCLTAET